VSSGSYSNLKPPKVKQPEAVEEFKEFSDISVKSTTPPASQVLTAFPNLSDSKRFETFSGHMLKAVGSKATVTESFATAKSEKMALSGVADIEFIQSLAPENSTIIAS